MEYSKSLTPRFISPGRYQKVDRGRVEWRVHENTKRIGVQRTEVLSRSGWRVPQIGEVEEETNRDHFHKPQSDSNEPLQNYTLINSTNATRNHENQGEMNHNDNSNSTDLNKETEETDSMKLWVRPDSDWCFWRK